ncbi:hypothetical protein NSERUTF1_7117 [Nocardia seriolae]|nr:hypothetical protein NSERUTF1_7117 [Nocardia seriolae]
MEATGRNPGTRACERGHHTGVSGGIYPRRSSSSTRSKRRGPRQTHIP